MVTIRIAAACGAGLLIAAGFMISRALKDLARQFCLRGDVAHKTSGKAVACSRWISDFFDGQCRGPERMPPNPESSILKEHRRAIFAVLDHQRLGPHGEHLLRCPHQAEVLGEHFGLGIINEQGIDDS